jgi:hypothetical protein
MSERIMVMVETVAVVILAIVVVIYAQVLWQRFQTAAVVTPDPVAVSDEVTADTAVSLTEAERAAILAALEADGETPLTPEERRQALDAVSEEADNEVHELDAAARMDVLNRLEVGG